MKMRIEVLLELEVGDEVDPAKLPLDVEQEIESAIIAGFVAEQVEPDTYCIRKVLAVSDPKIAP